MPTRVMPLAGARRYGLHLLGPGPCPHEDRPNVAWRARRRESRARL